MTPKLVGDVLERALGYRVAMTPYGFDLLADDLTPRLARLQRGSGIAGRGGVWMLVTLPAGKPIVTGIRTKTQLSQAVLEFMAGPPPGHLSDYTKPRAKRVMLHTGASRFVWYRRRKKRKALVAPAPNATALR